MKEQLNSDANGWSRVSDSRPWRGKQALSEQHETGFPKQNRRDRAKASVSINHHYRYRATPCRGETKGSWAFPNTRTRAPEPGLMSASRGTLSKIVPHQF